MDRESASVSVIVPVFNGGAMLSVCLAALKRSTVEPAELIAVDDCSTDDSGNNAAREGALVYRTDRQSGPAAARNLGAANASGEILCFIDADCEVHPDTLESIMRGFIERPDVTAIFGSYDERPGAPGFFAQYKNLTHRYVHQTSSENATTFWAGCGAIRRAAFEDVGGFDSAAYSRPSIEDIELGYRLSDAGYRILIAREVQVRHHKAWTFRGMVHSDIFDRAIPWTRLILSRGKPEKTLNLQWNQRVSAALVFLLLITLMLIPALPAAIIGLGALAGLLLWINLDFYGYLRRLRGLPFVLRAVPVHWLTLSYSAAAFVLASIGHRLHTPKRLTPPESRAGARR